MLAGWGGNDNAAAVKAALVNDGMPAEVVVAVTLDMMRHVARCMCWCCVGETPVTQATVCGHMQPTTAARVFHTKCGC